MATQAEKIKRAEERCTAAIKRYNMLRESLTDQERCTVWNALRLASQQYEESAAEFRKLAALLRRGESYPMFADGEPGALAADRLAAQFDRQLKDSQELIDRFE